MAEEPLLTPRTITALKDLRSLQTDDASFVKHFYSEEELAGIFLLTPSTYFFI